MKTSKRGIDLIKQFEGCRLTAYQDSVGVWTIGYGLTSAAGLIKVTRGLKITQNQAEEYLVRSLEKYETAVMSLLKRPPTQNQFDAMVSFCYNVGPGNFAKSSVLTHFNAGSIIAAGNVFAKWNKAAGKVLAGLVKRRAAEAKLFLTT
jgi:GH24 family phage-related lysozyme (muramidase)